MIMINCCSDEVKEMLQWKNKLFLLREDITFFDCCLSFIVTLQLIPPTPVTTFFFGSKVFKKCPGKGIIYSCLREKNGLLNSAQTDM